MSAIPKYTSADLETFPENGNRYEIVGGDLIVSRQPSAEHQFVCGQIFRFLTEWNEQTNSGTAFIAPGLIFADDDDVAPDVMWISQTQLAIALQDGKFYAAPELVVEVLSPGIINHRRDRETKLKLYSRRGVLEYWIVDWQQCTVEIHRREQATLQQAALLYAQDQLISPLFPGFSCLVGRLFFTAPTNPASQTS